jgi:uncharacterized membrane protein
MTDRPSLIVHSTRRRTLAKAVTYRIITVVADIVIVYALTRSLDLALGFTVATNVASALLYYAHERIWADVPWGRHVHRVPDSGEAETPTSF